MNEEMRIDLKIGEITLQVEQLHGLRAQIDEAVTKFLAEVSIDAAFEMEIKKKVDLAIKDMVRVAIDNALRSNKSYRDMLRMEAAELIRQRLTAEPTKEIDQK